VEGAVDLGVAGEIEPEVILGNQYVSTDWKKVESDA